MSTSGKAVFAGALLALVCAIAFPLAPVHQPTVDYAWPGPSTPAGPSTTALPLMPYQPVSLSARLTCDAVRSVPVGAPVLATTPPQTPDGPVGGLRVTRTPGGVAVTSNGTALASAALAPSPCTIGVSSTPSSTTVTVDGRAVGSSTLDVRPVVAAVIAPSRAGITLGLRTDTRFETTPSTLKIAFGVGALLGLAVLLAGALALDGRGVSGVAPLTLSVRKATPSRRPRIVDAVIVAGLAVWAVVGPASVDDGYIAGMVRGRGENGVLGNVYRWLNAPEAPFSWFYEVERAWAALHPGEAASVLWMRVPAVVLGVLTWLLVSRHALPRLGPALRRPSAVWIAAVVFAAWWLPFGITLRPEPWVATGTVAVWVATERAVATRRVFPLAVAALLGGLTVALTPGALGGVVPLLVALPALARGHVRAFPCQGTETHARGAAKIAAVVGAGAIAVLPMAVDQSLGGILESTRVRQVIGGGAPWYEEFQRYATLLTPDDPQGSLGIRLPVLLLLVAVAALAWSRRRPGIAPGASGRLLAVVAVTLLLLAFSPTKWTMHFGTLAGLGTATVTLFVVAYSPRALRSAKNMGPQAVLGVLAATLLAGALVLIARNEWFYASTWGVFWNDIRPQVARIELSGVVLYAGLVLVIGTAVVLAVRGTARIPRWLAPGAVALVLAALVVALVGGSFLKVTVDRAGTYSLGSDSLAALRGDPCGLASDLRAEPDPRAGLLPPGPGAPVLAGFVPGGGAVPLRMAGEPLPGWSTATGGTLVSGWYRVPNAARRQEAPVVVTVSGSTVPRSGLRLEFATSETATPTSEIPIGDTAPEASDGTGSAGGTAPRDLRALAPAEATLVRVVAVSAPRDQTAAATASPGGFVADVPLAVSAPRVPVTVPFDDVVPRGSDVLADWPVGLAFGCLRLPALSGGTAEIPSWRLTTPGETDAGEISVAPKVGGPYLTPRMLVDEVRVPVVLNGDPTRDAVGLVRWVPRVPLATLVPTVGDETASGWARDGRATVPTLDTP